MKPLTLDQAAMYMTLFYHQNMDKPWDFVFPDIVCDFRGLKIGDFELEKQKMAKGWKLKKKDFEGCPLFFTYDRHSDGYVFLLYSDYSPVNITPRVIKMVSFEDKI